MREGAVGEVIQVFVQKSYEYGEARPQDEAIDGGLFRQVGIHAARMVEHVGGVRIQTISGWETAAGSPEEGDGKVAAAVQIGLENGGLATIILNYLNPPATKIHGNETLRIFGTKGFIESVDGGARTRLVTAQGIVESLDRKDSGAGDYFDFVAAHLTTGAAMPPGDSASKTERLDLMPREEKKRLDTHFAAYDATNCSRNPRAFASASCATLA